MFVSAYFQEHMIYCESNGHGPRSPFLSLVRELAADARSSPLPGIFETAKCRKRWFLAHCGSPAPLQPLEPGQCNDQKCTEGIGTTLTPRRLKCNALVPAQYIRSYG